MKTIDQGLWTVGSEARYLRVLAAHSSTVNTKQITHSQRRAPLWQTNEKTLHLVLATAYNAAHPELVEGQPTAWWSSP